MKVFPSILIAATASLAAAESDTIHKLFIKERRFTLFNSRQLEGKCMSVCRDDKDTSSTRDPTVSPTESPTSATSVTASSSTSAHGSTASPTESPTLGTDTPTKKPTKAPTDAPTKKPTKAPTDAPTKKPTKAPTDAPTKKPTKAPTDEPTKKPTKAPTEKPTKRPTKSPTKAPTEPPVSSPSYECVWPEGRYSAITKGDMISGAKNVYHSLAVGGKLKNPAGNSIVVDGKVYHVGGYQGRFNFNGGVQKVNDLADIPVDYAHYEWLAKNLKSMEKGKWKVIVKTTGKDAKRNGCYGGDDFNGSEAQGEDNGNTLVVFNTSDDICLTKSGYGRQFGPSVLAPFSKVTLTDSGYLDGVVIAKEFTTVKGGNKGTEQQLHGDTYTGPLECIEPEPTSKPTETPEKEPTKNPVAEPEDDGICSCDNGSDVDSTWRCGANVYMCPSIDKVCATQPKNSSAKFFVLSQEQCDEMKKISVGQQCIALPEYKIKAKNMVSRVCYNKGEHGMEFKRDKCKFCEDSIVPTLERRALSALENPMTTVGSFS